MRHPHVLQLIMDSLRYWVTEMHVDGFRFDLAATLARQFHEVDRLSAFFDLIQQDPVISQVKLIAEPWDVGEGGYQVGNFPPLWTEWNGKYRDTVRDFWRGEPAHARRVRHPAHRVADLYEHDGRKPSRRSTSSPPTTASPCATWCPTTRSTTRPTARATATARATTARGTAASRARPTTPRSSRLRERQKRNFLATLLLSQGVPMLAARRRDRPHPAGQQQRLLPGQRDLLGRLGARRRPEAADRLHRALARAAPRPPGVPPPPVLPGQRRPRRSRRIGTSPGSAVGEQMDERLAERLRPTVWPCSSTATPSPSRTTAAERVLDDSFLVLFNADHEDRRSPCRSTASWEAVVDTGAQSARRHDAAARCVARPRSSGAPGAPAAGARATSGCETPSA